MSKHVSRKERWTRDGPTHSFSTQGQVVYEQRAWYGVVRYRTLAPAEGEAPVWTAQTLRLGPFKRPRNAMIAVEEEAMILQNRHGRLSSVGQKVIVESVRPEENASPGGHPRFAMRKPVAERLSREERDLALLRYARSEFGHSAE